jgi:transaldolase
MKRITLLVLFSLLAVNQALAQQISSPIEMWAQYSQPETKLVGSVRTVLTSERRVEYSFGVSAETFDQKGNRIEVLSHSANTVPDKVLPNV